MNRNNALKALQNFYAGNMREARKYYNKIHEPVWPNCKVWFVDKETHTATSGEETISVDELQARKQRARQQGFTWTHVDFADAQ